MTRVGGKPDEVCIHADAESAAVRLVKGLVGDG